MFDIPKIINIQLTHDNELLLYFETGIIKRIDITPYAWIKDKMSANIELSPDGLVLNGKIISNCDLWSTAKFYGWNRNKLIKP